MNHLCTKRTGNPIFGTVSCILRTLFENYSVRHCLMAVILIYWPNISCHVDNLSGKIRNIENMIRDCEDAGKAHGGDESIYVSHFQVEHGHRHLLALFEPLFCILHSSFSRTFKMMPWPWLYFARLIKRVIRFRTRKCATS